LCYSTLHSFCIVYFTLLSHVAERGNRTPCVRAYEVEHLYITEFYQNISIWVFIPLHNTERSERSGGPLRTYALHIPRFVELSLSPSAHLVPLADINGMPCLTWPRRSHSRLPPTSTHSNIPRSTSLPYYNASAAANDPATRPMRSGSPRQLRACILSQVKTYSNPRWIRFLPDKA
jgi:hypothetical protein